MRLVLGDVRHALLDVWGVSFGNCTFIVSGLCSTDSIK